MKSKWLLCFSLFALPGLTLAASPNYTFVEGGYKYLDIDDVDDGDGLALGGGLAVNENIHLVADYSDLEFDIADFERFNLGVGVNLPLDQTFDVVFRGGWANVEAGPLDDDGRVVWF